jgi:hypothetical protein
MSRGRTPEGQLLLILAQCLRDGIITKEEYFQQQRELLMNPLSQQDRSHENDNVKPLS